MKGFPINFGVNAGDSVLQHPLYLKWNVRTISSIKSDDNAAALKADILGVMATNDNMPILWYLSSICRIIKDSA